MITETKMTEKLQELKQSEKTVLTQINILQGNIVNFQKQLEQIRGAISITEEFLNPVNEIAEKKKENEQSC